MRWGALIGLGLAATPGCVLSSSQDSGGHGCLESRPFTPEERSEQSDAEALLAPYFRTWRGRLVWLDTSATQLTLLVEQDPEQPLYRDYCPSAVHTLASVTLRTDDGALNDSLSGTVSRRLRDPKPPYNYDEPNYNVSPSDLPASEWQGTLASKIPGLGRYESSSVVMQLEHGTDSLELATGALVFSGTLPGASRSDVIAIGTWFPQ